MAGLPNDEVPADFAALTPVAPRNSFDRPLSPSLGVYMTSTPHAVPSSGLFPSNSSVHNSANQTYDSSERSRFFQYDQSGAILFMDESSPPLAVIDRMLNNFRYDPTRPKCTGYSNPPEVKCFTGQAKMKDSVINDFTVSNSMYVTAKSHVSETTNESTNILAPGTLNLPEPETDENPKASTPLKHPLQTILEDENNSEKMDIEVVNQAEETFCDIAENMSTVESALSLLNSSNNVLKPNACLDSSSVNTSIFEGAQFLLKTPKNGVSPRGSLSANSDTVSFSAENSSTVEDTQFLFKTPFAENSEIRISDPFSSYSKNCISAEEPIVDNTQLLMNIAKALAESNVPTITQLPAPENSSLISSFFLNNVSFNDGSTFISQREEGAVSPKGCHVLPCNSPEAFEHIANIPEKTTADPGAKTRLSMSRKSRTTARRSSIHNGRLSVTKVNVSVPFKVTRKDDGSNKILRRSKRLSTSKLKASATKDPVPIENNNNKINAPSVAAVKPKGRAASKLPIYNRKKTPLQNKNTADRIAVSRPASKVPPRQSSASVSTERNNPRKSVKPVLPRQSVKTITQPGNARSFVSRLPQKSSIPQAKIGTTAQTTSVRPSIGRPARRQLTVPSNNRTSTRQSGLLPENSNANRTFVNPYVSRTQLISSVHTSARNLAKKPSAAAGARWKN